MWWSFRKSKAIAPGVKVHVSWSGPSLSVGTRGRKRRVSASLNVGRRGGRVGFSLFGIRFGGKLW